MSGLLHPVGPQPPGVYWLRRALVLGVLAAVVALLVALFTPAPQQQAVPAAAPSSVLATAATVAPSASPGRAPSSAKGTPTTQSSAAQGPAAKATAKSRAAATSKAASAAKGPTKASKRSAKPRPKPPISCRSSQLRLTLNAPGRLKAGKPATFQLSVINDSASRCVARVTGAELELRIFSGRDRIWSSTDCSTAVKPVKQKLAAKRALKWQLKWDGRRSAPKCGSRPEMPEPGTYITTARLRGAEAVQARTILHG